MYESIGRNDRDVMCGKCYSIGQSGKRIDLDSSKIMLSGKERSLGTDKGKT